MHDGVMIKWLILLVLFAALVYFVVDISNKLLEIF